MMEVAAIIGHKDLGMVQRYTHFRAEDLEIQAVPPFKEIKLLGLEM